MSEPEMVRRMARVLGCQSAGRRHCTAQCDPEKCEPCLDFAGVAIAAMREPTAAMIKAAVWADAATVWRAMIDAALLGD